MEIWAVEPENAAILAGGNIGTHLQMGIGDGVIPAILNQNIYDDICIIKDDEALNTSKLLFFNKKLKIIAAINNSDIPIIILIII